MHNANHQEMTKTLLDKYNSHQLTGERMIRQCSQEDQPQHDKTNQMNWAHSEDSDQPKHTPSLI